MITLQRRGHPLWHDSQSIWAVMQKRKRETLLCHNQRAQLGWGNWASVSTVWKTERYSEIIGVLQLESQQEQAGKSLKKQNKKKKTCLNSTNDSQPLTSQTSIMLWTVVYDDRNLLFKLLLCHQGILEFSLGFFAFLLKAQGIGPHCLGMLRNPETSLFFPGQLVL